MALVQDKINHSVKLDGGEARERFLMNDPRARKWREKMSRDAVEAERNQRVVTKAPKAKR